MVDTIEDTIEKVNRVKQKLIKYSEKSVNNEKVLEYLGTLKILGINAEIAEVTKFCYKTGFVLSFFNLSTIFFRQRTFFKFLRC
jgi:hypothetical protein